MCALLCLFTFFFCSDRMAVSDVCVCRPSFDSEYDCCFVEVCRLLFGHPFSNLFLCVCQCASSSNNNKRATVISTHHAIRIQWRMREMKILLYGSHHRVAHHYIQVYIYAMVCTFLSVLCHSICVKNPLLSHPNVCALQMIGTQNIKCFWCVKRFTTLTTTDSCTKNKKNRIETNEKKNKAHQNSLRWYCARISRSLRATFSHIANK